jgi:hypothetical protein
VFEREVIDRGYVPDAGVRNHEIEPAEALQRNAHGRRVLV